MTEVLIVARTRFGTDVCVGGLRLDDNANLRLMSTTGSYQPVRSPFQVGEVYEMALSPDEGFEPPHVENVRVIEARRLRHETAMQAVLRSRVAILRGDPSDLFEGKLHYTSTGRLFIGRDQLPRGSVAFWEPDRDLRLEESRYVYPRERLGGRRFTYAGVDDPVETIPAGTIVRISLARWWPENEPAENQRCYTQVSGWFDR